MGGTNEIQTDSLADPESGREMPRNEEKSRSVRTALRDLSNRNDGGGVGGGRISKSAAKEPPKLKVKLEAEAKEEKDRNDDALDRLLLVQSDVSALIHQIDELVAQAFQCKGSTTKEVKAFTNFLSEMISSLKPWVPRFQKALDAAPAESAENEVGSAEIDSPRESLISPSPLVSWRADCTIKRGRHLFKLTPLPISKSLCSKPPMASRSSVFDRIAYSNDDGTPLFHASFRDGNDGLLGLVATKPTPSKPCSSIAAEAASNLELAFASTPMFSKQGSSMVMNVRTPSLKMSPPKSCVVLEPISESSPKGHHKIHKSTPYPVGFTNCSESSDSEATEDLAFRYPELLALQQAYKPGIQKKHVETSPEWNMSPPKTCVLLQPPDEKPSKNAARFPITTSVPVKEMSFSVSKENNGGGISLNKTSCLQEPVGGSFALIESTPIWKEAQSIVRTGKHPGENTLKRELWTKFEAATTDSVEFKDSVTHRGFLDRLDEVCDGD